MTAARRTASLEFVAVTIATSTLTAILIFVVPEFIKLFADYEVEMPIMTLILMDVSYWTLRLWFLTPLVPIGICLILNLLRASRVGGESWNLAIWVLLIVAICTAISFIAIALFMPLVSLTEQVSAR
jgi:type II secretory pathway component PulF